MRESVLSGLFLLLLGLLLPSVIAENLLSNGDFHATDAAGEPVGWRVGHTGQGLQVVTDDAPDGVARSLRVDIRQVRNSYGEVEQKVAVTPDTSYILAGSYRSSADGVAFYQIKLYRDRHELRRVAGAHSSTAWQRVEQTVFTGDADTLGVICRYLQNDKTVGQSAWFADVSLSPAPPPTLGTGEAVATFDALGVRVGFSGGIGPKTRCRLRFRARGVEPWREAMDLFPCSQDAEFRGSVIGLAPGTTYELECWLDGPHAAPPGKPLALTGSTWPDQIPIAEIRTLPAGTSTEPLVIKDQGHPDGWIVYRPPDGQSSCIEAGTDAPHCVQVESAAYVMLENVSLRGGNSDCVRISESHHIRIRSCDIAGWGDPGQRRDGLPKGLYVDGKGGVINYQAGVRVRGGSSQVVVEGNFIHAPRGTANSWGFGHPAGPQGVILDRTGGNNVVRYNDIIGSETHWWNDAIESISNRDVDGGPYRDTDIYGNLMFFSNDDGTELDGGQINVRFHHNWIRWALCGISCAPNRSGPSYVYRNLIAPLGEERGAAGSAFKMGGDRLSPGMNVIVHNTIYGGGGGLRSVGFGSGSKRGAYIAFSRNNLFAGRGGPDITNVSEDSRNDFDYDLVGRGGIVLPPGHEAHAVTTPPHFRNAREGDFRLAPGSAGIDQGSLLPGLNDDFSGKAPDMGAFEVGDDAASAFPPRPGMPAVSPARLELRHSPGTETDSQVQLTIPAAAGTQWTAHTNAPWLRCQPTNGPRGDGTVTVEIGVDPALSGLRRYRGAVTFRTDRGFCRTLAVDAKGYPATPVSLVFEAEAAEREGAFALGQDPAASGGTFVYALETTTEKANEGHEASDPGSLTFTADLPADGVYYLRGRCLIRGPHEFAVRHDSFYYSIDDGERIRWDVTNGPLDAWHWAQAGQQSQGYASLSVTLTKGQHHIRIYSREPLAQLDRLAITNIPYLEDWLEVKPVVHTLTIKPAAP